METQTAQKDLLADFHDDELSLFEMLDHVLGKGIVIAGEITISVANVDLLYLGVNILAGSVDTIQRVLSERNPK
jgi:hypothetical protein